MNRNQRRNMEKKYGILEIKKKLPLNEKMRLLREKLNKSNVVEETKNKQEEDNKISNDVYSRALTISTSEKISFVDALQKAQSELSNK